MYLTINTNKKKTVVLLLEWNYLRTCSLRVICEFFFLLLHRNMVRQCIYLKMKLFFTVNFDLITLNEFDGNHLTGFVP